MGLARLRFSPASCFADDLTQILDTSASVEGALGLSAALDLDQTRRTLCTGPCVLKAEHNDLAHKQ